MFPLKKSWGAGQCQKEQLQVGGHLAAAPPGPWAPLSLGPGPAVLALSASLHLGGHG